MRMNDKPSNIAVLEACSMLNPLSAEERMSLAEHCYLAFAERGEFIWLAGSPSTFSGIVGTGFVKMTKTAPQGSEVAVELLGPGQGFGFLAAIEGRPFPLSAVAVTNVWYLKVPTPVFQSIYAASQALRDQLLRSISPRLRRAFDMMARMSTGKVEGRIAAVLLLLMDSYGEKDESGIHLQVPLTRQDIAEMAGTTVETTIRVMSRWQKDGLVSTNHQVITILDPATLNDLLLA